MHGEHQPVGAEATEMVSAVVRGAGTGIDRSVRWYGAATGDGDRAELLDGLAAEAGQSAPALEALLTIVATHHLALPAIQRLVADRGRAEDIEQDVLIAVARSVGRFRGDAGFKTWLHTVARNTTIDVIRRTREQVPLAVLEHRPAGPGGLSSLVATSASVRAAVDALPEAYRQPVVMRDLERRSYEEIAERLGLNLNTVKSRIHRGRALLASTLRVDPGPGRDGFG